MSNKGFLLSSFHGGDRGKGKELTPLSTEWCGRHRAHGYKVFWGWCYSDYESKALMIEISLNRANPENLPPAPTHSFLLSLLGSFLLQHFNLCWFASICFCFVAVVVELTLWCSLALSAWQLSFLSLFSAYTARMIHYILLRMWARSRIWTHIETGNPTSRKEKLDSSDLSHLAIISIFKFPSIENLKHI